MANAERVYEHGLTASEGMRLLTADCRLKAGARFAGGGRLERRDKWQASCRRYMRDRSRVLIAEEKSDGRCDKRKPSEGMGECDNRQVPVDVGVMRFVCVEVNERRRRQRRQ